MWLSVERYELRKAEERAHILEGLIIASDNMRLLH
jgi:DNA gyrase/topoisomerase IV subunit A